MNKLLPAFHGILDYILVIFFLLAPSLFTLTPTVGIISYLLGVIHLMLTLFTNFSLGIKKIIPFRIHGFIELVVAVILIAMPALMGESLTFYDSLFFIITGAVILIIWILSRYKQTPGAEGTSSSPTPSK